MKSIQPAVSLNELFGCAFLELLNARYSTLEQPFNLPYALSKASQRAAA
jgi:hypothetical protein